MASDENEAVQIVDRADVAEDGPLVHVDSVEKTSLFSFLRGFKKEDTDDAEVKPEDSKPAPSSENKEHHDSSPHHKEENVHDGDGIKTTYDVEEDVPPSLLEQAKRKVHWNGR